jgi:hypothetical protein
MHKKRSSRRRWPVVTLAAVAALVAAWWWLLPDRDADETAPAGDEAARARTDDDADGDDDRTSGPPLATALARPAVPAPEETEPGRIVMGGDIGTPEDTADEEPPPSAAPRPRPQVPAAAAEPRSTPGPPADALAAAPGPGPAAPDPGPDPDPAGDARAADPDVGSPATDVSASPMTREARRQMQRGEAMLDGGRLVEARFALTTALRSGALAPADAASIRQRLATVNDRMVFSPELVPGDPFSMEYQVQPSDSLAKIAKRLSLPVDWRFLQRINRISRPEHIRVGQRLKVVTGPFHAVVHKSAYRLDLFLGEEPDLVYVCSLPVGLGEHNSTPTGLFRVRPQSKLVNPEWVNPRTRERFTRDDPENPIGEFWIGLEGLDDNLRDLAGYGIHGTVEPDSIGRQASMGCVRMLPDDIALVYEVLAEEVSLVRIVE